MQKKTPKQHWPHHICREIAMFSRGDRSYSDWEMHLKAAYDIVVLSIGWYYICKDVWQFGKTSEEEEAEAEKHFC